ncbi:uncharacterized protein LOC130700324 isoform X1 [Daphnia carinata]|uniref:uncharacterized protein LOC130700324 isoform X1 n=1 Tax=Daphnia carinata TaxID=120202 RepID=UPI002868B991|nr:uncharacterized protein LOC130700324 isoform X1 [Daphnia carinata]XP_059352531.1 uncharacterized protein LOC130700324 isoform X1 [Daphnia carinata]
MDNISLNGQLELRQSRSGRIIIPRLRTWTGERAIVNKKGALEILEGNIDYTSTFLSERSLSKPSPSNNHSHISSSKPDLPQTKLVKAFRECVSEKEGNINGKKTVKSQTKASPKKNLQKRKKSPEKCRASRNTVPSSNKVSPLKIEKQKRTIPANKVRTPSPRKNLRKQQSQPQVKEVDIFGPEFQPTVRLVRLLPEEILSLTEKENKNFMKNSSLKSIPLSKSKETTNGHKKKKVKQAVQINLVDLNSSRSRRSSNRHHPHTVRETQKILSVLNRSKNGEELEDEAMSTAAFFGHSPNRPAMKLLDEAVETLRNDFESDDNLSIRAVSERESSPMSSAVSPIGSFHETDAEISGREDGLLAVSPAIGNISEFQRARLLHRTLKDKAKMLRKAQSHKKKNLSLDSPTRSLNSTPSSSQLLKPRMMRALEKDLTEKTLVSHGKWDYSTYYRGNLLHVTINSDSETDDSAVDSLDEL